jgi:hypothetical protein
MIEIDRKFKTLPSHLDYLQKNGVICFSKRDILSHWDNTEAALNLSLRRQTLKKRILRIHKDFYVIIPIEYQDRGSPPPDWYIDQFMNFMRCKYYTGLLSAASLHGAAHQQPMQFQVITEALNFRQIKTERTHIRFFTKRHIPQIGIEKKKTAAGYMNVSCPELTIYDLVRYPSASGQLNNIGTIIAELSQNLNGHLLVNIANATRSNRGEMIYWQRLGYILDFVGAEKKANQLAKWVQKHAPSFGYLVRSSNEETIRKDNRWYLYINTELDIDV